MRARYPDCDAIVARDGVEIRYERYGQGRLAILLLPAWSLVHSRYWKMQIPYLARHFTVVCFDGRGNGGSDRPADASAYSDEDAIGWALETDGETLTAADRGIERGDAAATRRLAARGSCRPSRGGSPSGRPMAGAPDGPPARARRSATRRPRWPPTCWRSWTRPASTRPSWSRTVTPYPGRCAWSRIIPTGPAVLSRSPRTSRSHHPIPMRWRRSGGGQTRWTRWPAGAC